MARAKVSSPRSAFTWVRVIGGRLRILIHDSYPSLNQSKRSTKKTSAPIVDMFLRKARSSPVMAVPISVTVTTPMTIPRVVRIERSLLARIAPHEIPKPSLSSEKRFIQQAVLSQKRDMQIEDEDEKIPSGSW